MQSSEWILVMSAVRACWGAGTAKGVLRAGSAARYMQVFDAFCRYADANGVRSSQAVTTALCRRFIDAPLRGGHPPCPATSRLRLTVLRSAFEALISAGIVGANPTDGLRVRHETPARVPTPLTPSEAARLAVAIRVNSAAAPWPATCALALMGAAHGEIAAVVVADLDETASRVKLGEDAASRTVPAPPSLAEVLARRAGGQRASCRRRREPWDPATVPLALSRPAVSYPVNSVAPTVSQNLARALRHAGIHRPGVRPKSVREYAANALYAKTQRIEAVAEQLGLASFDTAAGLIDRAWQQRWGEVVRAGGGDDG